MYDNNSQTNIDLIFNGWNINSTNNKLRYQKNVSITFNDLKVV